MRATTVRAIAAFVILCAFATPALADCNPLTLITSVDLTMDADKTAALVPVTLQGQPKFLLLDTGGAMTVLTPQAADELKLDRIRGNFKIFNVSGEMSDTFVHTSRVLGRLTAKDIVFVIQPGSEPLGDDSRIAGVLAPDILQHYDVDIDYGAGKLNLLSPDHCEGKVIYWKTDTVAVVPMHLMDSGHIQIQVELDGKPVLAILDTGAYNTTLTRPVAEHDFGLTMGTPDTPATGSLQDLKSATIYRHTFKTLAFEGIAVSNVRVDIIPDMNRGVLLENATADTGTHIVGVTQNEASQPMLIGMNILKHFHIYIAYKEKKLYITPASSP